MADKKQTPEIRSLRINYPEAVWDAAKITETIEDDEPDEDGTLHATATVVVPLKSIVITVDLPEPMDKAAILKMLSETYQEGKKSDG